MPPASSILSPLADPFCPEREGFQEYASFGTIYNDGVAEGILLGNHADHGIIHNIPDAALEEIFPPNAADAAELDAVDDFLRAMVDISFLEENEERTREDFSHTFKKRWEARRQEGLVGRPHAASLPTENFGSHGYMMKGQEERLVHYDRHRRAHVNALNRRHLLDVSKQHHHTYGKKASNKSNGCSRPIHQPRKMN